MKNSEMIALALAGVALWMMVAPRKAASAAAPGGLGSGLVLPSIFHPADAYAGSWTANGPMVPSSYDKQIWD